MKAATRSTKITKTPAPKADPFALLANLFRRPGSGVPSVPRRASLALLSLCALAAALLALTAAPAAAKLTHEFEFSFSGADTPHGSLQHPFVAAVDNSSGPSAGDLYVGSFAGFGVPATVYKFDQNGHYAGLELIGAETPQGSFSFAANNAGFAESARGLAVDGSSGSNAGDLYVADVEHNVIDRFSEAGKFLCQITGKTPVSMAEKEHECAGAAGSATPNGGFSANGVAVNPANGDVYVADRTDAAIDEFSPAGAYLGQIADPHLTNPGSLALGSAGQLYVVNGFPSGFREDVVKFEAGGSFAAVIDSSHEPEYVAVDPLTDHAYVSRNYSPEPGRPFGPAIAEYGPADNLLDTFGQEQSLLNSAVAVTGSTGRVYVTTFVGGGEVLVYGPLVTVPDVTTGSATNFVTAGATLNGTVNPDAIPLTECRFQYVEAAAYKPGTANPYAAGESVPCAETPAEISSGSSPVAVHADLTGLKLSTAYHFRLVAANANGTSRGLDAEFESSGPPTVAALSADAIGSTKATLHAKINPHHLSTTFHFDYITEADFKADGNSFGAGRKETPESAPIGSDSTEHAVSAALTGLEAETSYRYRVVATNSAGPTVAVAPDPFTTLPPALLDGPWAADVSATAATLDARIDPLGAATDYRLEWGPTAAYGHLLGGSVGSSEAYVPISYPLGGLQPHTVYHYRLTTSNAAGSRETADATFTTQPPAAGLLLPDQRAWEQVTPPDKQGADISFHSGVENVQAAASGEGVAYIASTPVTEASRHGGETMVLSTRTPSGWRSVEPMPAASLPEGPTESGRLANLGGVLPPPFLSSDLSRVLIEPNESVKPLSPEATERTLYLWDAATGAYLPLVTPANVPPGTRFALGNFTDMEFLGATPDLSHVVLTTSDALTPEAPQGPASCELLGRPCPENLYEWSAGRLQLLSILPNGQPATPAYLGSEGDLRPVQAISTDGRWVVWTLEPGGFSAPRLYVRDTLAAKTYQVGGESAKFETTSADGSRVFYLEGGDLHLFKTATRSQADLTPAPAGEPSAGVQDAILGASEDGSYVYLVAHGVLEGTHPNAGGEAAQSGKDNLYLLHDTGSGWKTAYIATLSPQDEHDWSATPRGYQELRRVTSHVSLDGRFAAFMSNRSLTGYDNVDARSGERDEEAFLFDAETERLVCVSCDPTGARPHGLLDKGGQGETLVDPPGAWEGRWLAASLPGWRSVLFGRAMYQPRVVFDSGRLFFQSPDALVPQDTNGTWDVYEYEPPGVGTCTEQSLTFSPASGGCVSLISNGTSSTESAFYDASESGNDVFFTTTSQLAWTDVDKATDVYDARVGGGFPEPLKPPPCEGDACQPPTEAPNDATPGSLTHQGPGNERPINHRHHRKHHRKKHHKRSHRRVAGRRQGGAR